MCDFDLPDFMSEKEVTARKAGRCYECRSRIAVGARCISVAGKWDGRVERYRFCRRCWRVHAALRAEDSEHCGVAFGEVREALWERYRGKARAGAKQ